MSENNLKEPNDLKEGEEYSVFDVDSKVWEPKTFEKRDGNKFLFTDGSEGNYVVMKIDLPKCIKFIGENTTNAPEVENKAKSKEVTKPNGVIGMEVSMEGLENAKITLPKGGIIPITKNFKNGLEDIVVMGKVTMKDNKLYVEFADAELAIAGVIRERDGDKITKFDLQGVSMVAKVK